MNYFIVMIKEVRLKTSDESRRQSGRALFDDNDLWRQEHDAILAR